MHRKGAPIKHPSSYRHVIMLVILGAVLLVAFWPRQPTSDQAKQQIRAGDDAKGTAGGEAAKKKVEVLLHVMSLCPDARFCESAFQRIIAAQNVSSLVSMRIESIARLSEGDKDVSCMHGPNECTGNKLQLCLQAAVPPEHNLDHFYEALLCHGSGDVADTSHLKACMAKSNIPADVQDKALTCASGPQGLELQVASAKKVRDNKVVKSCTVFIAGKKRCIRDGGRWYDCEGGDSDAAFAKTICEAHKAAAGAAAPECAAALRGGA